MTERKRRAGAYARIYDGFPSHPKVVAIPRSIRPEAIGTWTLCLSWSNDQLRDGFIPGPMVEELGGTLAGADALVASKLWRTKAGGYQFVNYSESQSTRADVEASRAATAERKRRSRAKTGDGPATVTRDTTGTPGHTSSSSSSQTETTTEDDHSQLQLPSGSPRVGMDSPSPVDNARRNPTAIDEARVVGRLEELVDAREVTVTVIEARLVAEHFLGDRDVQHPTRYVLSCITKHSPEVTQFLHTGRWSS